jgi:hypothetical protein
MTEHTMTEDDSTEAEVARESFRTTAGNHITVRGDQIQGKSEASFEMFEVSAASVLAELSELVSRYEDATIDFRVQGWGAEGDTLEVEVTGWREMRKAEAAEVAKLRAAAPTRR